MGVNTVTFSNKFIIKPNLKQLIIEHRTKPYAIEQLNWAQPYAISAFSWTLCTFSIEQNLMQYWAINQPELWTKPYPTLSCQTLSCQTLSNLSAEQILIQHYPTRALSKTLSNLIQLEHWAKPYPTSSNPSVEQNLIQPYPIQRWQYFHLIYALVGYAWYYKIHTCLYRGCS